ncbi:MAG: hypothetical protein WCI45_09070, partial [Desulfuromonadales bacterium]
MNSFRLNTYLPYLLLLLLLQLAFSTYGSCFSGDKIMPQLAYDSFNKNYLSVYLSDNGTNYDIYGELIKADGTSLGGAFQIAVNGPPVPPAVAYDSINNRHLVIWGDSATNALVGRLVGPGGALIGFPVDLTTATSVNIFVAPALVFDSDAFNFLVVWQNVTTLDIYGQVINNTVDLFTDLA